MLNWLFRKTQNARFGNQITQTLWLVEELDLLDRAHALLWVGVCREQTMKDSWKYSSAFHWPEQIPRDELVKLYYPIEELRITVQYQCEKTLKDPMFAEVMGAEAGKHMRAGLHGWQIILATMASGLAPHSDDKTRLMWSELQRSHEYLGPAMERFVRCLRKMGARDFPYYNAECIENARLIPEKYVRQRV